MSTLLVITTGQTDVQLVLGQERRDFKKDECGNLHDQLEKHPDAWLVSDSPVGRSRCLVLAFSERPWVLCTPKLDAVIRWFEGNLPDTVLLLETCRRTEKSDPRFAGGVLERRLNDVGVHHVLRRAYLQADDGHIGNPNEPSDAIIRRDVVSRIDCAVRDALTERSFSHVVVATSGGPPEIKALVNAVVRLHAQDDVTVQTLEVEDGARYARYDEAISRLKSDPIESYRARRHALDLVEGGSLLGAWGAVQHLDDDENERRWIRVIKWLRCFASSLPMPKDCDIPVLNHKRMAVRAALRVELALRAEDIPRAVHGTVAFFEAALWDRLGERATRHPDKKRLFSLDPIPAEELVRRSASGETQPPKEDLQRPFILHEMSDGTDWYRIDDSEICAIRIAKRYLHFDGLTKFGQAASNIRELRNDVAHNEPTQPLMEDARRRMTEASLWSQSDTLLKPATFLSQPLVQNVLRELGEPNPAGLCVDLISEVRTRLLAPMRLTDPVQTVSEEDEKTDGIEERTSLE